ncbi:hypothetical protein MHYP_G00071420 [Metynnis hypsauchen]
MLFRVIVSSEEIRRVTLESVPESIKELCEVLRSDLGLRGNFILQFQDPEFGNELCNLTNIKDLPIDRATLKVLFTCSDSVSDSTLDTASTSSPSSASVVEWPEPFVIPDFSHDVELQLSAANKAYAKDGTVLVISKGVKSEILDKLADMISKITPYPNPPEGQSAVTSEEKRKIMLQEVQKREPNLQLLDELMTATFSQRRKEIIGDEPLISVVVERWPALFSERQITAEFSRIVTTDLVQSFLDGLDVLLPSLLQLYKAAVSSSRRLTLSSIMDGLQKEAHDQTLDVLMKGMRVGLLTGYEGVLHKAFPLEIFNVAVVVEETIILHSIRDVPTGFAMLMGTIYCLNLEYPRKMRYSFEFLQRVIMKIKPDQCSARIHGLRNKLLRYRL